MAEQRQRSERWNWNQLSIIFRVGLKKSQISKYLPNELTFIFGFIYSNIEANERFSKAEKCTARREKLGTEIRLLRKHWKYSRCETKHASIFCCCYFANFFFRFFFFWRLHF